MVGDKIDSHNEGIFSNLYLSGKQDKIHTA